VANRAAPGNPRGGEKKIGRSNATKRNNVEDRQNRDTVPEEGSLEGSGVDLTGGLYFSNVMAAVGTKRTEHVRCGKARQGRWQPDYGSAKFSHTPKTLP